MESWDDPFDHRFGRDPQGPALGLPPVSASWCASWWKSTTICPEPIFALTVKTTGTEIYGTNTLSSKQPAPTMKAGEQHEVDFTFDLNLMPTSLSFVSSISSARNWSYS